MRRTNRSQSGLRSSIFSILIKYLGTIFYDYQHISRPGYKYACDCDGRIIHRRRLAALRVSVCDGRKLHTGVAEVDAYEFERRNHYILTESSGSMIPIDIGN